jgi:hypothetical protein
MMAVVAAYSVEHDAYRGTGRQRGALPFGAVMATGAVSQLSGLAGVPRLRLPLLIVAVATAVFAAGAGVAGMVRAGRRTSPTTARFGAFTVPVGLAVIAAGLAATSGRGLMTVAVVVAALAGLTSLLTTTSVPFALMRQHPGLADVNGVWFIGPAAFLAVAVATAAIGAQPAAPPFPWDWVGLGAVAVGTAGYAVLLVAAALRVVAHGISDAPAVAWWIVTGCGGLAALALGRVAADPFVAGAVTTILRAAGLACGAIATIVLVPVALGSVRYLRHVPLRFGRAAWPPAFSTGVYALGCAELADMFHWPPVAVLARIAAMETMVVWAVIAGIRVVAWLSHFRAR